MTLTFKTLLIWPRRCATSQRGAGGNLSYDKLRKDLVIQLLDLDTTWAYIAMPAVPMRADGWPRADANPTYSGVCLVFDSHYGQLLLPCDTFTNWQVNLRAITTTLANFKAIAANGIVEPQTLYDTLCLEDTQDWLNRQPFGAVLGSPKVSKGGAKSRPRVDPFASAGAASPPKSPPNPPERETFTSLLEAAQWLAARVESDAVQILTKEGVFLNAYRRAARELHPDAGGDPADFRRLQNAKAKIDADAFWARR